MENDEATPAAPWWQRLLELEPALIRGLLVALAALLLAIFNRTVIEDQVITAIVDGFVSLSALVSAFLIRRKVFPEAKVLKYDDTPFADEATIRYTTGEVPYVTESVTQIEAPLPLSGEKSRVHDDGSVYVYDETDFDIVARTDSYAKEDS